MEWMLVTALDLMVFRDDHKSRKHKLTKKMLLAQTFFGAKLSRDPACLPPGAEPAQLQSQVAEGISSMLSQFLLPICHSCVGM